MKNLWLLIAASLLIVYSSAVYDNLMWPLMGIGVPVALFLLAFRYWPSKPADKEEAEVAEMQKVQVDLRKPQNIAPKTQIIDLSNRVDFNPDGIDAPMSDGMLNWFAQQYFKNGIGTEFYRPRI